MNVWTISTLFLIPILLMLIQENAGRLAEWLTRSLAKQLPKRSERRLEEWLDHLDSLPNGYTRLLPVVGFALAAIRLQQENLPMLFLKWLVGSGRILSRIAGIYLVLMLPYWVTEKIISDSMQLNTLPFLLFIITFSAIGLQTDDSDFSWHPKIAFGDNINIFLFALNILSLLLTIIFASVFFKFAAMGIIIGYWLVLEPIIKKLWGLYILKRKIN